MYRKIELIAPYNGLKTIADKVINEKKLDTTTVIGDREILVQK